MVGGRGYDQPAVPLVLFDLDNTLIDRSLAFRRWAERFCRERGLIDGSVDWLIAADQDGYRARSELFSDVRNRFHLSETEEQLMSRYRVDYPTSYIRDQAVIDALGTLRAAGWKVGIVTNGPPSQAEKIAVAGLADAVDACCISEVVGVAKPEREIFEAAAAMASCELSGWMVGDNPIADIGGGQAVGLETIWISRGQPWGEPNFRPSHVCNSLARAVQFILTSTA